MDLFQMRIFQHQLVDQLKYIVLSAKIVNNGLSSSDADLVFFGIQSILGSAANTSKMLWGQRGRLADARKPLRDSIGVLDTSSLRDVNMRNNFEHMDERIDRWWAESQAKNHADKIVGNRNAIGGMAAIDMFRWFNPEDAEIMFWGEAFNLQRVVAEAERLLPIVQAEALKPHWES